MIDILNYKIQCKRRIAETFRTIYLNFLQNKDMLVK